MYSRNDYRRFLSLFPDQILLFSDGNRYYTYDDSAEAVCSELDLTGYNNARGQFGVSFYTKDFPADFDIDEHLVHTSIDDCFIFLLDIPDIPDIPDSCILTVAAEDSYGENCVISIVTNSALQNSDENIFYYERGLARRILSDIALGVQDSLRVDRSGISFVVYYDTVRFYDTDFENLISHFFDQGYIEKLTVYRALPFNVDDENYTSAVALLWCEDKEEIITLRVLCNTITNEHIVAYDVLRNYINKYGFLYFELIYAEDSFTGHLNKMSPLKLYGYDVSAENNYSSEQRHSILKKIIDNGLLSKYRIESYLQMFIRLNRNHRNFENALSSWQNDLSFVNNYKPNSESTIFRRVHF